MQCTITYPFQNHTAQTHTIYNKLLVSSQDSNQHTSQSIIM